MTPESSPRQDKFHGWFSLAGVMTAYGGICGTITYAYGVFLPAMSEEFGWSRSSLSGPYTLFVIIGGMLGPLAGFSIARFGARRNIIFCNIFAALGLLGMSQASELWHVYLFFGFMAGVAIAFAEYLPVTTIINNWFIRRRSFAMGMLFTSGGLAGFVFPPLISWLITDAGWRLGWLFLAVIHLLLTVILAGILIKDEPGELGQVPDGTKKNVWLDKFAFLSSKPVYSAPVDWTLGEALRTPALWLLIIIFSVILFVLTLLTTHQVAYLQDLNYSPLAAASALGLMLGISIVGRIISGVLGMRFEGRHLAAIFLVLMWLGVLCLINAGTISFVYLYAVFTGIGFGGMIVLMPNLIGAYFGRANYPRITGWTMPVVTLAFAGAPLMAGFFHDATGTYLISLGLAATLLFACVIITLFACPPVKNG